MNVTMLSGFWPSRKNPISGIFVQQQAEAFAARGMPLTVVVPVRWPKGRLDVPLNARSAVARCLPAPLPFALSRLSPSIRLCALDVAARGLASAYTRAARTNDLNRAPNILHCQDIIFGGLALSFLRSALSGPFIMTVHGESPLLSCYGRGSRTPPLIRRMWDAVDAVAIVGSPLAPYVERLGCPPEKIRVVPNGTFLPSVAEPARPRASTEFVVCSIANLTANKAIDDNLRALARFRASMPSVQLSYWIIGDGPERTALELLVVQLDLKSCVRFLGRLPYDETMRLLSRCDVFALPSWREGFGIAYLEAMARGKAVIGCATTGAADIIRHEVDGFLVPPHRSDRIADILLRLYCDRALKEAVAANARRTAERFTWDHNVQRYLQLYREVGAA